MESVKYKKRYSWKRTYREKVDKETRRKISRIAAFIKDVLFLAMVMIMPFILLFALWLAFGY